MLPVETSDFVGFDVELSEIRSREAARPTEITEEDLRVLLAHVIAELARLQVEAWFRAAQSAVEGSPQTELPLEGKARPRELKARLGSQGGPATPGPERPGISIHLVTSDLIAGSASSFLITHQPPYRVEARDSPSALCKADQVVAPVLHRRERIPRNRARLLLCMERHSLLAQQQERW